MFFRLTGNFGVAVILFTILVKGILLPLDVKSKKSTAKIQEIQPQINLINEKYANDPEKKSKKMQEVYAANHINPLGGCLPMLLTMPVIIIIRSPPKNSSKAFSSLKALFLSALTLSDIGRFAPVGCSLSQSLRLR